MLCLLVPIDDSLAWIGWKLLILDYKLVKVVSQKVSARVATMTVEDSKERALGPVLNVLLAWWLHDVEHDADSILVVISDDSLVCVGGVGFYNAAFLLAGLCGLMVFQLNRLGIQNCRIVTEKKSLDLHKLNVWIFMLFT